ncbi:uncharacterized protein LOC119655610 isoform X4 [Hermetia illucens]|uniref:uncharacterized protein LOC119655610 isoform X4 n=1 Tax=Hermetia illucens TaxID=343691 RepID=UPI0018CC722A|nr:uncharacterized protein LOC119655610 isoform X4 [Hermetia illucens]
MISSQDDNNGGERARSVVNPATTTHMNGAAASENLGGGSANSNGVSPVTRIQTRRPQTQTPSPIEQKALLAPQVLSLTIHKDSNGYGMKVSGDNPVFVESVKAGGAAQKAGLIAGDMILKVNGVEVRLEKHTTVVQLIKSRLVVELTVQRSREKMQRPNSLGSASSTPVPQRDRITGPQPVDSEKRREMEHAKIRTLRLMLDQEKKNLENLVANSSSGNRQDRSRAEANIRKLQEQLRQVGGEDPPKIFLNSPTSGSTSNTVTPVVYPLTSPQHHHSSPAFLSRFPRSLSSLSLGTRKKTEKDIPSPLSNIVQQSPDQLATPSLLHHHHQQTTSQQQQSMLHNATPSKRKFIGSEKNLKDETPPPLPQRNPPRKLVCQPDDFNHQHQHAADWRRNIPISDLDNSVNAVHNQSVSYHPNSKTGAPSALPVAIGSQSAGGSKPSSTKKRPKTKTKALSDPKMSTQMFLQMEKEHGNSLDDAASVTPPPLPPRQPGMMEECQNFANNAKTLMQSSNMTGMGSGLQGSTNSLRPLPNSIDTLMNYPLVATCTPIRDNLLAFPLSQRPNIVQKLQHHQQQQSQQFLNNNFHHNLPSAPTHSSASVNKSNVLGQTPPQQMTNLTKHRRVVSSPEHIQDRHPPDRHNKSSSGSWELLEKDNEPTPPGTPPPPYLSPSQVQSQNLQGGDGTDNVDPDQKSSYLDNPNPFSGIATNDIMAAQANAIQKEIILMDDDEVSDQECLVDEEAPFNYLVRLLKLENTVYLAVFLNYLLSNCDPVPLLFYLITDLYKEGTAKDMRKWAYEIHSTFLVPSAPLLWFKVDESLAREVDNILQYEYDKVEILKKVFWKSRKKAKEKINEQLRIFQQRRIEGMGTIYGPTDQQLAAAKGDKAKEQKIFEETLLPKLQDLVHQIEHETPPKAEKLALSSALSTVLHRIFITRSNPGSPIDSVHHFVSREKSFKSRLMGKNRKMVVLGHPLVLRQYYEVTHCNHCQTIIWGVSPQGLHCTDCKLNIHRNCLRDLEESCPGPVLQKRKEQHTDNKISKFMEKIRPTHHFIQNERARRVDEEATDELLADRPLSASVARQPSDRRPDSSAQISGGSATASGQSEWTSQSVDSETNPLDVEPETSKKERSKSKSAPVSVNRSESYKERLSQKRSRNNRRKTSDPSLTKTNDEQDLALSNHAGSCSSSSLSSTSLESPSISLEQVTGPSISNSINISQLAATATSGVTSRQWLESEEEEPDHLETDWSSNVAAEILATLSDIEKKRQEIINEIYQTERSHVRTLKLLDRIFMRPLLESGVLPHDHLQSLFPPGLLSLKDIHSAFEYKLKQRRSEHGHVVRTLGDLLSEMFEGRIGEDLREYAAQVCAHQQIALEALKEKRRKDENLHRFLAKAESHKSCRRLQLKDLLPTVLQRLTKYPLLFENLVSITKRVDPDNSAEVDAIQRALDSSKRILVYVNQAVKAAEDAHKLQTIQRKLDKSSIDKDLSELRNLDLTQYKLIYDGHLQLKKIPSVQLHGLLFENMMVLLQKLDDKYLLRSFPHTLAGGGEGFISPITHFDQQTLVRQSAVDKNTFFLIITKTSQMLELKAPSSSECKTWFKHISDAAEQYKPRSKSSHDVAEDPASATLPHSNTKESLESATDRLPTETPTPDIANVSRQAADQQSATRSNNDNVTDPGTEPNTKESQRDSQKLSNDKNSDKETTTATDKNSQTEQANKKCDSSSTLYSNNSNNTRTLTQHCALLEPSEIQISISPAHTAEPVLTNSERLRRLDDKIRSDLLEKERIICDMFRVPHEHFAAIVDIASQPEAPKDTSNIALAAFAHVQTLTELVNQFMKITPEQEISAVSTAVCDRCYLRTARGASPMPPAVNVVDSTTAITTNLVSPTQAECDVYDDKIIQEDDGYCQIDELRLPSIGATMAASQPIPVASSSDSSTSDATPTVSSVESKEVNTNAQQSGVGSGKDASEQMEKSATKKIDVASEVPSEGIQKEQSKVSDNSSVSEDILQHDDHDTTTSSTKCPIDKNDASQSVKCQFVTGVNELSQSCGPNRFSHAHSLGPSVPCHVISGIVTALSSQISLLLPKINERDIERERLRRENQNLRELLNSMHARQRVEEEKETPENIKSADNPPT